MSINLESTRKAPTANQEMIFKSDRYHNYICAYLFFVFSFTINIGKLSCSYCSDETKHEHCSSKNGAKSKILSHCQKTNFIQLRSIVPNDDDENNSYCETLDIENDERVKFFFIETSQRDHLRKY